MNKLTLIGNVVNTPVLRTVDTAQGPVKVADFRFAADNMRNKEETVFIKATAWRGAAEALCKYVQKGTKLYLAGPVGANAYIDKKTGQARAEITMRIEDFEFAGNRSVSEPAQKATYAANYDTPQDTTYYDNEDDEEDNDLPF